MTEGRGARYGWHALHVHLPHSLHTTYLVDVVRPALQEQGIEDDFFFLRYWQGGPHLRLRLSLDEDRSGEVVDAFRSRLTAGMPVLTDARRDEYEAGLRLQDELARLERESPAPSQAAGSVVPTPYVPEWRKYGGTLGVAIAERVFRRTSLEVLDLLSARVRAGVDESRPPVGEAARVMVMLMSGAGLSLEQAVPFLRAYEDWWSTYAPAGLRGSWADLYPSVSQQMRALCSSAWGLTGGADEETTDVLRDIAHEAVVRARLDADRSGPRVDEAALDVGGLTLDGTPFDTCLSNYVHTTNNRLGLVPAGEGMVAHLVRRGVEDLLSA